MSACKMEYYSAIKKNEIVLFEATLLNLENVILSEVSRTEKDKFIWHHLYVKPKKKKNKWNKKTNRLTENKAGLTKRKRGGANWKHEIKEY